MDWITDIFTASGDTLNEVGAGLRMLLVYVAAVIIVRLGKKRFMAESSAFDVIVGIMLGSILSRAVNGSAHLGPSLVAATVLVATHWALSWLTFRSHRFGALVKGNNQVLVEKGEIQWAAMKGTHVSKHDLQQALRLEAHTEDVSLVEKATLERSGEISIITQPKVVEIDVRDGVKTVRLEIA